MVLSRDKRNTSVIALTGTPGVGKKSVAPLVAESLGLRCISLNDLAVDYGLSSTDRGPDVDVRLFRGKIRSRLRGNAVLHGHLVPYVLPRVMARKVVVLRCDPSILKERLRARGYPDQKIIENVEAELIGLLSSDSLKSFGPSKTVEIDASYDPPAEVADQIVATLRGGLHPRTGLDWLASYDTGARLRSLLST